MCSVHKAGKFHDSNPDLRFDLPILPQGLPAVILEGLPAGRLEGLPAVRQAGLSAVFIAEWRTGGMF